jgi:hypothetical protein
MPQHGDYDTQNQKWYCSYWMTQEEWLDIHDYSPPTLQQEKEQGDDDEE